MLGKKIRLLPLSEHDLEALLEGKRIAPDVVTAALEITDPLRKAIRIKLGLMKNAPDKDKLWLTYWLIVESDSSEAIGTIGFKGINKNERSSEIGYGISSRFEGKGYATEALRMMVAWAKDTREIEKITAIDVLADNIGSHKVLEKNGFCRVRENSDAIDFELILEKH